MKLEAVEGISRYDTLSETGWTHNPHEYLSDININTEIHERLNRCIDLLIAFAVFIVSLPLFISLVVIIRLFDKGPVLFKQERVGRYGTKFNCLKFRTMKVDSEKLLHDLLVSCPSSKAEWERDRKLRTDPRVSKVGSWLRKTSIDELPQLLNVIVGEMSIVGPRPIVSAEIVRYGRYIDQYYRVRPGITGLWQISGRNDTTYRRRVACDVTFVKSDSPVNRLRILAATVPVVLLRRGAY